MCRRSQDQREGSLRKLGGSRREVNFVFVELPILSQNSYIAATAALASEKQGLYNDYHLSLMSVKGRINEDVIFKIAKKTFLKSQLAVVWVESNSQKNDGLQSGLNFHHFWHFCSYINSKTYLSI